MSAPELQSRSKRLRWLPDIFVSIIYSQRTRPSFVIDRTLTVFHLAFLQQSTDLIP